MQKFALTTNRACKEYANENIRNKKKEFPLHERNM